MQYSAQIALLALGLASCVTAGPVPDRSIAKRVTPTFAVVPPSSTSTDPHDQFDPSVVQQITCGSSTAPPKNNQQIAELLVCNGIQAPINNCPGALASTTSTSGTAKWTLTAPSGGTLNFFKGTWEECANAARAACPNKTFTGTCLGGVTNGVGFTFTLSVV